MLLKSGKPSQAGLRAPGVLGECLSKIVQGAKTQQKHTHGMTEVHVCADFGPRTRDKIWLM